VEKGHFWLKRGSEGTEEVAAGIPEVEVDAIILLVSIAVAEVVVKTDKNDEA
jgi:hypothetical protein